MLFGNKGDWSEIYVLFKLLGEKHLQPGDSQIQKIKGFVYPILQILRSEATGNFQYSYEDDIVVISGNEIVFRVPIGEFRNKAKYLLDKIIKGSGVFSVPEIEDFMHSLNCFSLKASSSAKTDITIIIHDQRTGLQQSLGFSIKSQLGSPSTLLNAGETTNFIFKIFGEKFKQEEIDQINSLFIKRGEKLSRNIKGRIKAIYEKGWQLRFYKTQNPIFNNNLILIDSLLPEIIANLLLKFASTSYSTIKDLTYNAEEENPLKFDKANKHLFYDYKVKRFLTDIALGMMPSKVWDGKYDATGGYLIVKATGDVLCYHIYDKNEFENYLFENTKLDTASTSRYGYGDVYEEDGELYIKLNLQIRFK